MLGGKFDLGLHQVVRNHIYSLTNGLWLFCLLHFTTQTCAITNLLGGRMTEASLDLTLRTSFITCLEYHRWSVSDSSILPTPIRTAVKWGNINAFAVQLQGKGQI